MLPTYELLKQQLRHIIANKDKQGHVVTGLADELQAMPDSYDALAAFAKRLAKLPLRPDWRFVEPNSLEEIWKECDPKRPLTPIQRIDPDRVAPAVEAAFIGSVCGCILGKPLEINPDLQCIRAAAEPLGEWPLRDYISEAMLSAIGKRHGDWVDTVRGKISYVACDDDINYTILGMMLLEQHGRDFTKEQMQRAWLINLPCCWCWGPERVVNIKAAMRSIGGGPADPFEEWTEVFNPNDEHCGAVIRADAYGYACAGNPALAAELAYRDASFTHRRTGIYGTMFVAAAIATAFVVKDPLEVFRIAAGFVPQRSRFGEVVQDSIKMVSEAKDWIDGYSRVHNKYRQYDHCHVYQEIGTLINTLRFAPDVGEGICMQVSQGNDTDSFGATCGSILGAYFGPGHLEERWVAPFNDTIHTTLAMFHEQRLSAVAKRMGRLPRLIQG